MFSFNMKKILHMWWNDIRKVFENLMTKETYSNTVWELKKQKQKQKMEI